jgi:putative ABC transport system substrate-binding protein
MNRKFTWLVTPLFLAYLHLAEAQQSGKIARIGFLDSSTASGMAVLLEVFRQELNNLGWVEGKNVATQYRFSEGRDDRLPELAADLVRLQVDLMVAAGTTAVMAAKNATTTIPIIFTNAGDPVGSGLVVSLARPGANVTGIASLSTQLNTKRLEVLKDSVPQLSRLGLLTPAGRISKGAVLQIKEIKAAAMALELKLEEIKTQLDAKGLESAFQTAKQAKVGAITTTSARPFSSERKRIVDLAVKYGLPAIYFEEEFVEAGGLMSYGTDFKDLFRKSAHYADKILKGAKPADLPVEQPTKFELVINLKAAKQIGLTIPPHVLGRADRVIR